MALIKYPKFGTFDYLLDEVNRTAKNRNQEISEEIIQLDKKLNLNEYHILIQMNHKDYWEDMVWYYSMYYDWIPNIRIEKHGIKY